MKSLRIVLPIYAIGLLVLAATAVAQDTDKDKLIAIEKAFAASPDPGEKQAALSKQYLYDGNVIQLTPMGRVGSLPKARVVELSATPNPADPDAKSTQDLTDFRVDVYGSTALVSYKQANTDTGHKDPLLNTTIRIACLDTFVKSKGDWFLVGDACSPSAPVSPAVRQAIKKSIMQQPKDVQQAYH
jgi:hypothetical protein